MEDDFYYGELPELPPPVANTTQILWTRTTTPWRTPTSSLAG